MISPTHVDTPEAFGDALIASPKRVKKRYEQPRSESMCPHCGQLFRSSSLIPIHDEAPPARAVCPGSGQNPRNPLSDRRPLWNGKINPHAQ